MACRESNALSVQFRELLKDFCERSGVTQWSRAQYEAAPPDQGNPLIMSAQCTGQPGDTEDELLALFASSLEHTGLRAETTAIYCCVVLDGPPLAATAQVAHYTARVYEF